MLMDEERSTRRHGAHAARKGSRTLHPPDHSVMLPALQPDPDPLAVVSGASALPPPRCSHCSCIREGCASSASGATKSPAPPFPHVPRVGSRLSGFRDGQHGWGSCGESWGPAPGPRSFPNHPLVP